MPHSVRTGRRPRAVAMFHVGRSGSRVLGDLLGQHPEILWDGEVLRPLIRELTATGARIHEVRYADSPESVVRSRMRAAAGRLYGFETKFFHLIPATLPIESYLQRLERIGVDRYILLERKNTLRKVVSSLVGRKRGRYHEPAGRSARLTTVRIDPASVEIDSDRRPLRELLEGYARDLERFKGRMEGRAMLHLTYEDDVAPGPLGAYTRACRFLGVAPARVEVRYSRTTPFPLREVIENFDEVRRALRGTPFERLVEED